MVRLLFSLVDLVRMAQIPTEKALELALEQHRSGHFQRAQDMYMLILEQDPGNVDAIHLLGVLANQGNRPDVAVEFIARAIRSRPDAPVFHYNYADALVKLGRLEDAAASYAEATRLNGDYFEAWNNLSSVLVQLGRFEEAVEAGNEAYELADDPSAPLNNLGSAYRGLGQVDKAIECYSEALESRPQFPEASNNLGLAYSQAGDFENAERVYRETIRMAPAFMDPYNNLGVVFLRQGKREEAAEMLQMALKLAPDYGEAMNNLGVALRESGRPEESLPWFEKASEKSPNKPDIWNNLALAYKDVGKLPQALKAAAKAVDIDPLYAAGHFTLSICRHLDNDLDGALEAGRKAADLAPNHPSALCALGYKLIEVGDVEEGLALLKHSLSIFPDPEAYSNVFLAINYLERFRPEDVFVMHEEWGRMQMEIAKPEALEFHRYRDPHRRLRVGYMSPDFRMHSVFFFAEPILRNHNKEQVEVFCYSNLTRPDSKTIQAQVYADHWRDIGSLKGEEIVETIRADELDILVELAGHTAGNLLPVLAHRMAPIQISAIGYPCTTGLPTIDYRISDPHCSPDGSEHLNTERLLRLPESFWCYSPPDTAPDVAPLPVDQRGTITFASINNFAKVTEAVQDVWAQVLLAVPDARLILQAGGCASKVAREKVAARFASHGVAEDRLDFRGHAGFDDFMRLFEEVDIVLDPFPFNGGTTTCHNLWMGTPTITLAGKAHAGRMGVSMLTNLGLTDLIAVDHQDYVRIAQELAGDPHRLREIRKTLRTRMEASPLRDEVRYTRQLEQAYRDVWSQYCASSS